VRRAVRMGIRGVDAELEFEFNRRAGRLAEKSGGPGD
jgi:hypothetical protein